MLSKALTCVQKQVLNPYAVGMVGGGIESSEEAAKKGTFTLIVK